MEDMMPRMSLSGVLVCTIIVLQIELALGFEWMNISRNIIACEEDDVQLIWGYKLFPGEYVKAKTWFTGENKTAKRIVYWKDTDRFTIEPAYRDRVAVTGNGNDSLILRRVRTSDEGTYTLIVNFPLSSEPDPRLALNLKIYVPPSQRKDYCELDINATNDELNVYFKTEQGCGIPLPIMNWNISRNKMVRNNSLILGDNDRVGVYKACLIGPVIARCYKRDEENLCVSYTVEPPPTIPVGEWIGKTFAILVVAVPAVVIAIWFRRRFSNDRWATRELQRLRNNIWESIKLIGTILDVDFLTKELVRIYKEEPQFKKADSQINLQTEIFDGFSKPEPDIDINIYRNIFERNQQPLKRILIQGGDGCGKTTWCNTLTQEWRKAHDPARQKHDPNNQELNDNITFLKEYKLLFNISLAKVHKFANFKDLLVYLNCSSLANLNIYDYIKENDTIIIIQGLDKCTEDPSTVKNILSDNGLEQAVVIITGTPSVWTRYSKDISFGRVINLKGFKKDDMIKRAKTMLRDDNFPQEIIDDFLKSIESTELEEFAIEPVFFPYLVEMWKTNCILPSKRAEFLLGVLDKEIKGKVLSLRGRGGDYKYMFENSIVFKQMKFIIHCGKIVKFLGEIAVKILIDNKNEIMIGKQEYDDVFQKQNLSAEVSYQFILDFCVGIKLLSIASNKEGVINTISFRHKLMLMFLAAIYISTLNEEEIQPYVSLIQSSNDLTQFLNFLSNVSN